MLNKVPTLFSFIPKKLTEHPFCPYHLGIGQDQMNQRGRDRGRIEERERVKQGEEKKGIEAKKKSKRTEWN